MIYCSALRVSRMGGSELHAPKTHKISKVFCSIEASAFAAVMFVLVMVMMISESEPHHGFAVDLPQVSHAVPMSGVNREDAMVIGVRRDGAVYFGAERVRSDELPSKILNRLKKRGVERKVYISVDRRAWYGTVKQVLVGVHSAGIERVAFLADQPRRASELR